jgi:hypothetical protein
MNVTKRGLLLNVRLAHKIYANDSYYNLSNVKQALEVTF